MRWEDAPPADRPMKPNAMSDNQESIFICLRSIIPRPKGPQMRPKRIKIEILGSPGIISETNFPNVCPCVEGRVVRAGAREHHKLREWCTRVRVQAPVCVSMSVSE